jgi:hypothetical protein
MSNISVPAPKNSKAVTVRELAVILATMIRDEPSIGHRRVMLSVDEEGNAFSTLDFRAITLDEAHQVVLYPFYPR